MFLSKLLHLLLQRNEAICIPNILGQNKGANTSAQSSFELFNLLCDKRKDDIEHSTKKKNYFLKHEIQMIIQSLGKILLSSGKFHYAPFITDCELATTVVGCKSFVEFGF